MTFPCAVDPEDRRDPVAQVNPAASKLGTPPEPPDAVAPPDPVPEELADPVPDELATAAPEDDAVVAGLEVVWELELLSVPQAARAMAPTARSAANAGNPVILVFFTRLGLSGSVSDRIAGAAGRSGAIRPER
jgi:hypothetical protein